MDFGDGLFCNASDEEKVRLYQYNLQKILSFAQNSFNQNAGMLGESIYVLSFTFNIFVFTNSILSVEAALDELLLILDPSKNLREELLVILCFDEAHGLTIDIPGQKSFTRFSELRRALRVIDGHPVFSVFLSTAGKLEVFSADPTYDKSARLLPSDLRTYPPITEISFDVNVKLKEGVDLASAASTYQIASGPCLVNAPFIGDSAANTRGIS
jgi:hypothetical protein